MSSNFTLTDETRVSSMETSITTLQNKINSILSQSQSVGFNSYMKETNINFVHTGLVIAKIAGTMKLSVSKGSATESIGYVQGLRFVVPDMISSSNFAVEVPVTDATGYRRHIVCLNATGSIELVSSAYNADYDYTTVITRNLLKLYLIHVPANTTTNLDSVSVTVTDVRQYYARGNKLPSSYPAGKLFSLTAVDDTWGIGEYVKSESSWIELAAVSGYFPVTVPNGGTGNTSLTANNLLLGNGTSAIISASTFQYNNTTQQGLLGDGASTYLGSMTFRSSGGNLSINYPSGASSIGLSGYSGYLPYAGANVIAGDALLQSAGTMFLSAEDYRILVNAPSGTYQQAIYIGSASTNGVKVGFGTETPAAKIHSKVAGSVYSLGLSGDYTGLRVGHDAGGTYIYGVDDTLSSTYESLIIGGSNLRIAISGVETARFSGDNFGLGVTPAAWTSFRALQISYGSIASTTTQFNVGFNNYYDGTNYRYLTTNNASLYTQISGYHYFYSSPTGNAGDPITFVERMQIDSLGNLLLGTSTNELGGSSNAIFGASKSGATTDLLVYNPSNTAGSHARIWISDGGTSAGSAGLLFTSGLGGTRLAMGLDSTDSDKFKIGNGYTPGSGSTFLTIDTSGKLNVGTVSTIYGGIQSTVGAGTAVPTLGVGSGHLTLSNGAYGLAAGVNTSGDTWLQAHRFDGTATAYNLLLQPVGGRVSIGLSGAPSGTLEIRDSSGAPQIVLSHDASNYGTFLAYSTGIIGIVSSSAASSTQAGVVMGRASYAPNNIVLNLDGESTSSYTADQAGAVLRFNGAGVAWGDLGYHPTDGASAFHFKKAGSSYGDSGFSGIRAGTIYSMYDASNYLAIQVDSGGGTTFSQSGANTYWSFYGDSASQSVRLILNNNNANAYGALTEYLTQNTVRGYIGALRHGSSGNVLFTGEAVDGFGIRGENIIQFGIGSALKMNLTSDGNLGLGTTTAAPASTYMSGTTGICIRSGNPALSFSSTATSKTFILYEAGSAFRLYDPSGPADRFIIDTNGNMALGSHSPSARFHVVGTSEQLRLGYDLSHYNAISIASDGAATISSSGPSPYWYFYGDSGVTNVPTKITLNNNNANAYGSLFEFRTQNSPRGYVGALKHGSSGDVLFSGETADGFGIRAETQMLFGIGATLKMLMSSTNLISYIPISAVNTTGFQMAFQYNGSNYVTATVNSVGALSFNSTGTGTVYNRLYSFDRAIYTVLPTTAPQFYAAYDGSNYLGLNVNSVGKVTFTSTGTGDADTRNYQFDRRIVAYAGAAEQLRLQYDGSNYVKVFCWNAGAFYVRSAANVDLIFIDAANNNISVGEAAAAGTGLNSSCFGYQATNSTLSASNEITLGNASVATLRCQVTSITALSDRRDKDNIKSISGCLDFISSLNPVSFDWNCRDGSKVGIKDSGFIAQDLKQSQIEHEFDFLNGLVYEANPEKLEAAYGKLIPVLVGAIKELRDELRNLKKC